MRATPQDHAKTGARVRLSAEKLVIAAAWIALLAPSPSRAQTSMAPDARAEALNESGKALYLQSNDYAAAAAKFRAAIAIRPDARYSYNLCAALAACDDVAGQRPRPDLADKAARRAAEIRKVVRSRATPPPSGAAPP